MNPWKSGLQAKEYEMAMSGNNWTSYPRGFLLGVKGTVCPDGFIPGPLIDNFFIHPETHIDYVGDSAQFVIVIGTCYSTTQGKSQDDPEQSVPSLLLNAFSRSREEFTSELTQLAGRYIVIVGNKDAISIYPDATAMRAVFYDPRSGVAGSHLKLVASTVGAEPRTDGLPIPGFYPGHLTPFERIKILTPNFYLALNDMKMTRFWPLNPMPSATVAEAAKEVLVRSSIVFGKLVDDYPVKLALTAGLDSRVSTAVGVNSGRKFGSYTYGKTRDTRIDRLVAPALAEKFEIEHKILKTRKVPEDLKKLLDQATYWDHHWSAVAPLAEWLSGVEPAIITTNILELGRRNYDPIVAKRGLPEPLGAEEMGTLFYHNYAAKRIAADVREFGIQEYRARLTEIFAEWIEDTGGPTPDFIDPFEQYFWEFRMSSRHGPMQVERDFYGEATNVFNSHAILEQFLAVSQSEQAEAALFYRLINDVSEGLLEIPINPKEWPPTGDDT